MARPQRPRSNERSPSVSRSRRTASTTSTAGRADTRCPIRSGCRRSGGAALTNRKSFPITIAHATAGARHRPVEPVSTSRSRQAMVRTALGSNPGAVHPASSPQRGDVAVKAPPQPPLRIPRMFRPKVTGSGSPSAAGGGPYSPEPPGSRRGGSASVRSLADHRRSRGQQFVHPSITRHSAAANRRG
jgi:hypothetical protein